MKLSRSFVNLTLVFSMAIMLFASLPVSSALAYSDGPRDPGTGSNIRGVGSEPWVDPNEITTPGSAYASVNLYHLHRVSNYLQGTQYGFNIPAGTEILGIEVVINRYSPVPNSQISDYEVRLLKDGVPDGSNKASTVSWPTTLTAVTYGSPTDLWGTTWTPEEINSNDFGAALSAQRDNNGNNTRNAIIDTIRVTVYYAYASTMEVDCGGGTPETAYGDGITCVATVTRAGGDLTPTGTVDWTTDGSGTFNPNPCTLSGTGAFATCFVTYIPDQVGIGSHLLTAAYAGDTTFTSSTDNQLVTVLPKAASVTPDTASKTYGEVDPTLTGTLVGFLQADGVTATYSRTPGETVLGRPYTISAVLSPTTMLSNYAITYNTANFTINPKTASVTSDSANKTYGDADPTFTGTLSGFLDADVVTATYSRSSGETVLGSPYTVSALLSPTEVLSNYAITYNTANFTINPKAASVTPDAASKAYGAVDPTFTGALVGFLEADLVTATYTRTPGETILGNPYTISAVLSPTSVLSNYAISYNSAHFTITGNMILMPLVQR